MLKRLWGWLDAWKYALAVVVILGSAAYVAPQYQRATEQCGAKSAKSDVDIPSPLPQAADADICKEDAERTLPRWYHLFYWPQGIETWAILLTLLALAEQTYATRKAAEAARDSISLQEANLRQWVAVEFIRSKHDGTLFDSSGQIIQQTSVEVRFQVVNPTPLPLTIKKVVTEVSGAFEKEGDDYERFTVEDTETLKPKGGGGEGGYAFYVTLDLVGEDIGLYHSGRLVRAISTVVSYESAARKKEEQSFASVLQIGSLKEDIMGYKGKTPHREKNEQKQD